MTILYGWRYCSWSVRWLFTSYYPSHTIIWTTIGYVRIYVRHVRHASLPTYCCDWLSFQNMVGGLWNCLVTSISLLTGVCCRFTMLQRPKLLHTSFFLISWKSEKSYRLWSCFSSRFLKARRRRHQYELSVLNPLSQGCAISRCLWMPLGTVWIHFVSGIAEWLKLSESNQGGSKIFLAWRWILKHGTCVLTLYWLVSYLGENYG